jgi:prephenate dehydrogenase
MAGRECRGAAAADPDLFRNRPWILTDPCEDHPVVRVFRKWIALFGAREMLLDSATHDRLVAWSSHLPQLASTALASLLNESAPATAAIAGPGLVDMTRLALSPWDLWRDILATNRPAIDEALNGYIAKLQSMRASLEQDFESAAGFSRRLREPA